MAQKCLSNRERRSSRRYRGSCNRNSQTTIVKEQSKKERKKESQEVEERTVNSEQ